ncbi:MAG: hypothetical protein SFY81_08320 [Verrucomicrobiota bacterium]|nr:hypothetical protein [Verrucomicrobiota bacterium]
MKHIELYFDESFNSRAEMVVGGLGLISDQTLLPFHDGLVHALANQSWGVEDAHYHLLQQPTTGQIGGFLFPVADVPSHNDRLVKGKALSESANLASAQNKMNAVCEAVKVHALAQNVQMFAFGMKVPPNENNRLWQPEIPNYSLFSPQERRSADRFWNDCLDSRFQIALRQCLELLLFELPTLTNHFNAEPCILALDWATRMNEQKEFVDPIDSIAHSERVKRRYGLIGSGGGGAVTFFSLGPDGGRFLLDDVLESRGRFFHKVTVGRAVARILKYDWHTLVAPKPKEKRQPNEILKNHREHLPNQIHYLADWITHFIANQPGWITANATLQEWFGNGFLIEDTHLSALTRWIVASRDWDQGNRAEAIRRVSGLETLGPLLLRRNAQVWSEQIAGPELNQLFA